MKPRTEAEERERRITHHMNECIHFNGTQHDVCEVGVNYRQLVGGPDVGWGCRLPCLVTSLTKEQVTCDKVEKPNRAEAEAWYEEDRKRMAAFLAAHRLAHDDAKAKGLSKGHGGVSEMPCPKCGTGILHYSVAGYNGHMHAKCTTENCLAWME